MNKVLGVIFAVLILMGAGISSYADDSYEKDMAAVYSNTTINGFVCVEASIGSSSAIVNDTIIWVDRKYTMDRAVLTERTAQDERDNKPYLVLTNVKESGWLTFVYGEKDLLYVFQKQMTRRSW